MISSRSLRYSLPHFSRFDSFAHHVCAQVAWKDENSPAAGFDYLYLTQEDFQSLPPNTVEAHPIVIKNSQGEAEEVRYKLISIIGQVS